MTTITSNLGPVKPTTQLSNAKSLGENDFLKLMTTQLRQQDPFNPMDNTQMVAQMAQFSSVAGISEINTSLKSIAERLDQQTQLLSDIRNASDTQQITQA